MFRTPSLRDSISVSLRKPPKRQERESGYTQVCDKVGKQSEHQRLLLSSKENQISWEDARLGLTEFIPFISISAI